MSNKTSESEQGELQGALTSLMSATSIVGPPLMTNLFSFFSKSDGQLYFPGAPFIAGAIFFLISTIITFKSLQAEKN